MFGESPRAVTHGAQIQGRISPLAKGPYFTAHDVCPRLIATEPGTAHVTENNMAVGDPADRPPATDAPKGAPLRRRDEMPPEPCAWLPLSVATSNDAETVRLRPRYPGQSTARLRPFPV